MPPNTRDIEVIRIYLLHMAEKVAARLRRHALAAQVFAIGLRARAGWIGTKLRSMYRQSQYPASWPFSKRKCSSICSHDELC